MRLLLDTHVLLWWFTDDRRLSRNARRALGRSDVEAFVSAVSAWEIAIKSKAGKLNAEEMLDRLPEELREAGFSVLPITLEHAIRAGSLPEHHRDPFDRMLVAQAQAEHLPVLSNDAAFDQYGVRRVW